MKATKEQIQNLSRLTDQAAFDSLRKTKTRWVSQGFSLQAIPYESPECVTTALQKFCVITSKKTAKRAVDRNRMRRRLKSMANEILPLHGKTGLTYMIVARSPSLELPADTLRRDLKWCLKKLGLLNDVCEARPNTD